MEILLISSISAMIVLHVGASHCPPFDVNTVNVKGVLGENILMQCDIDQKICDNVLWKKKPSAHHLNATGCDNGYCIHHTPDKSVLEFPNISPNHCGSYECWCNRGQPEALLISCFELSAVCQMRITLPGDTLVHNGSVGSIQGDQKAIATKPGDRHKIECQDGAEHITTCTLLDDGTFTVTEYEQECWHLCSLPVKEISETCDIRVSLRVSQSYGQHSAPQSDESLEVVRGKRVKRDENGGGNANNGTVTSDFTTKESISTTTAVSRISSTEDESEMKTTYLNAQEQNSNSALNSFQSTGTATPINESSPKESTTPLTSVTTTITTMTRRTQDTTTNENQQNASLDMTQSTITDGNQQDTSLKTTQNTITNETQQDDLMNMTTDRSKSGKPAPKSPKSLSIFDDCSKLSIFVAVGSFILSLVALMVAVSCCCYACFAFRHTGTAEITSKEAGGDDIALEGVTVKEGDTEDLEKGTQQEENEHTPPEQTSVTASTSEPTAVKSSETTEASVSQEKQEKSSTEAMTDGNVVAENHVVDETTQPEIKNSPKEADKETSNAKDTTATEEQKTKDPESPETTATEEPKTKDPESPEML